MKRFRSTMVMLGLCLFGNMPVRLARADPSVTDKAIAAQLFREGRALLEQGSVKVACPKFEESQRLDPGGGTMLNLALCHERQGRTATAWVEFTEALGIAKRDDRPQRVQFARAHIAQLEPTLSRVVVEVPRGGDLPDLEVRRDGSVVATAAWGSAIPIDPGDHLIEAAAPGKVPWRQSIVVSLPADTKIVVVPALEDVPALHAAQNPPAAAEPPLPTTVPPAAPEVVDTSSPEKAVRERSRTASSTGSTAPAWIASCVGLAATGVGTYFALHALSLKREADGNCPNDACSAQGAEQNSDAITSANLATVGLAVGAVGLGLATVLIIKHTAPSATGSAARAAPTAVTLTAGDLSVSPGGGEFTIAGRW